MSEEEIMEYLKNKHIYFSEYEAIEDYETEEMIQGILDLYNKEKENNKEIKQKLKEKNMPIETLLAEFERLENIEFELDKEKEKNDVIDKDNIGKLIKDNKQLELKLQQFYNGEIFTAKQLKEIEKTRNNYYIHKDKIKEKIEEAEKMKNESDNIGFDDEVVYEEIIAWLEELLKNTDM